MKAFFCGYHGHGQLRSSLVNDAAHQISFIELNSGIQDASCSWSSVVLVDQSGHTSMISGFINNKTHQHLIEKLPNGENFKKVVCARNSVLALSDKNHAWEYHDEKWSKLNTEIGGAQVLSQIEEIASNNSGLRVVRSEGQVFDLARSASLSIPLKVTRIACGLEHVVALTDSGDVYAWGTATRGQLGNGGLENCDVPQRVEALSGLGVCQISCGNWHSAAVSNTGVLYTWGWNRDGQLGFPCFKIFGADQNPSEGTSEDERVAVLATPNPVDFHLGITQVTCGARHTVVLADDGTVWGCGLAAYGQLTQQSKPHICSLVLLDFPYGTTKVHSVVAGGWSTIILAQEPR